MSVLSVLLLPMLIDGPISLITVPEPRHMVVTTQ
jgi:hypothetical protein